eukprot:4059513-Prymnesium_polylepis.1
MAPKTKAPAEDIDHDAFDEPSRAYGANTPKGTLRGVASNVSEVWKDIKRLKAKDNRSQNLMIKGYTHICVFPIQPTESGNMQYCHEPLKLTKTGGGTWIVTQGERHMVREHPASDASKAKVKHDEAAAERKVAQQLLMDNPGDALQTDLISGFTMTKAQAELSSQAMWYTYAKMHVSKSAFEDTYYKNMHTQAGGTALLTAAQLSSWVDAEFKVFCRFIKFMLSRKMAQAQGNAFAQFLHDGGTLKNHKKYQAFGIQFVDPDWEHNWVICFGFPRSSRNKDEQVAELAKAEFKKLTGIEFDSVFCST